MSEQTEEEYLIERLSKLLAEISVIVNGPQPMGVLWSYADLPQKVRALKDAAPQPPAEPVAWYVERVAPGYRDSGTRLGPWFDRTEAAGWANDKHELRGLYTDPQPQASAEDVALVDEAMELGEVHQTEREAWQRIKASLGVGK